MIRLPAWLHGAFAAVRALGPLGLVERQRRRRRDRRDYARWLEARASQAGAEVVGAAGTIEGPLLSVLMPTYETDPRWLACAVASVLAQRYTHWELCIADDASRAPHVRQSLETLARSDPRVRVAFRSARGHISAASNTALSMARGEFVALLDHDDELAPDALLEVAGALSRDPATDVLYTDEDKIDPRGRRVDAYLKPDWSPDLLLSQNFLSHLGVYRTDLVRLVGGFREGFEGSQDHDLALRVIEKTSPERIRHIPHVLYHWRTTPQSTSGGLWRKGYAADAGCRAIADHLARSGRRASVERTSYAFYRVRQAMPDPAPTVTVLALEPAVIGGSTRTLADAWGLDVELRQVDVGGGTPRAAALDAAVGESHGEIVVVLGGGCRPRPGWLEELVSQAARPEVGVVGGKVVSRWGRVLHAGYLLALDRDPPVLDAHAGIPEKARGHFGRAALVQNLLAVGPDCLAFRRGTFEALGGLDAAAFPGALYEVDLCLRARARGLRVVFTPCATVVQARSSLARRQGTPEERDRLRARWAAGLPRDPYWHPDLDRASPDFRIRARG